MMKKSPAGNEHSPNAAAAENDAELTIGAILRQRREARGISQRAAADALHMTIHQIEALEENRFDYFPAPTYARAFIKLYAQYLGLDYRPLTERYQAEYMPPEERLGPETAPPEQGDRAQKIMENLRQWFRSFPEAQRRRTPLVVALMVATVVILLILHFCSGRGAPPKPAPAIPRLIEEPPEPYLDGGRYRA